MRRRWGRRSSRPAGSSSRPANGPPSEPCPTPWPSAPGGPEPRSSATTRSTPLTSVRFLAAPFSEAGGVGGGFRPPAHPELRQQVRHVVLHGLLGQEDRFGDLPVGVTLGDQ